MAKTLYSKSVEISGYFDNAILGAVVGVLVFLLVAMISVVIIVFVIYVQDAERRIPVQYSKKLQGRRQVGGQGSILPIKVNTRAVA